MTRTNYNKAANANFHKLENACRAVGVYLREIDDACFDVENHGVSVGTLWRKWADGSPVIRYTENGSGFRVVVIMHTATEAELAHAVKDLARMDGIKDKSIPW
jgi:hypothetical protein